MQSIYRFEAMSTLCEIIIFSNQNKRAENCAKEILKETKRLESKYNYYNSNSLISKINRRELNKLDSESEFLITKAIKYYHLTDKTFDITVGTIKPLYTKCKTKLELESEKNRLSNYLGCEHFEIKRGEIIFDNLYTALDLGGFVKEYAIDYSLRILKKYKIKSALINYGGDIYALGEKPNGEKFTVGIKEPKEPTKIAKQVKIKNQALTTSASYERSYQIDKNKFSHIISKDNPIDNSISISVISPSCLESGVFSTSLILNPKIKTEHRVILL